MTRGVTAGIKLADALLEWLELMYNRETRQRILVALIKQLQTALD